MEQYLIDNNAISNFFSGNFTEKAMDFMSKIIDETPIISVITEIEALSWINPNKNKERIVRKFIEDANILPLNADVVIECVKIRRNRKVKTPDAIIAATAIVFNLILVTSDNDFDNITGLQLVNPNKL
jgi:predicted nucleic acid-binding protein